MVENISFNLGIRFDSLENLFITEKPISSVNTQYSLVGGRNGTIIFGSLPILDAEYLIQGVEAFRPYIRGFIVLLLVFFNWRNILGLIGQNPEIAHNAQQSYEKWREKNDS